MSESPKTFTNACPGCHASFSLIVKESGGMPLFCPFCGISLADKSVESELSISHTIPAVTSAVTLVPGHVPLEDPIQFTIGPYQILRPIGKGGMGEVFLAYDTVCGRRIALKRIRTDLSEHVHIHNRFLKEARVTSQLTHPAIIPIYSIHVSDGAIYYTMPYVEGDTLKQLLRNARQQEKQQDKIEHIAGSIPALIRIFLTICQAIGYAHSKGVLHRDIKPENVIVGKYGEVLILDWGLAKLTKQGSKEAEEDKSFVDTIEGHPLHALTHIGKIVGTIPYMAPERALGSSATVQADIYSLGVILYQILTLRSPFQRKNLKEFRKNLAHEVLHDPATVAPYRDVPRILAQIALKCLAFEPAMRYGSVDELLYDLEGYIEGRSEWFLAAELEIANKQDWEFQENILIAEHVAITQSPDVADWVSLMISKHSFDQNIKIEADICIGTKGLGIGFLFSVPEVGERLHLIDGYNLWLSSDLSRSTRLLRSAVEVLHAPDIYLKRNESYRVRIERIGNHVYFYLNGSLQFTYLGLLPVVGTHIGLLARDADFILKNLRVSIGGQNIMINCLAVPDAFLAHKDYAIALSEYRRIGQAFPGRAEGREAMFRAGITLLEQARNVDSQTLSKMLYDQALDEFHKLHDTSGAPLEYLGKALTYQMLADFEEEVKCFELALRRYANHPLLSLLKEQIIYRMHESSRYDRRSTYSLILLVLRYIKQAVVLAPVQKLFSSLEKHWEPLPFIEMDKSQEIAAESKNCSFAIILAFWLAKTYTLVDIIEDLLKVETPPSEAIGNAIFCLIELGAWQMAKTALGKLENSNAYHNRLLKIALMADECSLEKAVTEFLQETLLPADKKAERVALYLMEKALDRARTPLVHLLADKMAQSECLWLGALLSNCYKIWAYLLEKEWDKAGALLQTYPLELLSKETTPLHFLYGCWLYISEGKEIASIHFFSILDASFPRSWSLFSHYYSGKIAATLKWEQKAFLWEKRQLYRQQALFYECCGDEDQAQFCRKLIEKTYVE